MRNTYLEKLESIVKVKITGINIHTYIKRIIKTKINIIKLIPISKNEVHLILKYKDYLQLAKTTTTYQITIINNYGILKFKHTLKKNSLLLTFILIAIIILTLLSNTIFTIDIIHSDSKIRALVSEELSKYGIKKYTLKKDYSYLQKVKKQILENNKDKLEWLEIETSGTKYIVRIEERKLNTEKESYQYQSIISKKSAIITEVDATSGEILKNVNDYVKKGDTIISGYITHPDNTQIPTMAKGTVYGETWYTVKINYPYVYQEETLTGKTKTVYVINFLNKRISLFDFNKYKSFKSKDTILLSNSILNINLTQEKQYELNIIDEVYTEEETIEKAIDYTQEHLKKENKNIKEIKSVTILSQTPTSSQINLKLFVKAIENIGEISPITIDNNEQNGT